MAAALASLGLVASACSGDAASGATSPASTTVVADTTSTAVPTTAATTTTSTTSTTTPTTTLAPTTTTIPEVSMLASPLVAVGLADGLETARIQERLLELGFWLMGADGQYGHSTKQAVMAFQKISGLNATGKVDQDTAAALTNITSRPKGKGNDTGIEVEVDKDRQVLYIMNKDYAIWVLNVSTGSGQYYLEQNQKDPTKWEDGRSVTPSGRYKIDREKTEGWWDGDLGEIYRPKYFRGGIAIHGSRSIPNYPASHGCVRVSTAAMDMIWASGLLPKGTPVWVYGEDVEPTGPPLTLPPTTTIAPTTTLVPAPTTVVP